MGARSPRISPALARSLRAAGAGPADAAAAALAKTYAAVLDNAADAGDVEALAEYGPKLLAVLVELKLTPKARAAVLAGGAPGDRSGKRATLVALRERAARPD